MTLKNDRSDSSTRVAIPATSRIAERPRMLAACGPLDASAKWLEAMVATGVTQDALAAALDCSQPTVHHLLRTGRITMATRLTTLAADPGTAECVRVFLELSHASLTPAERRDEQRVSDEELAAKLLQVVKPLLRRGA